MIELNSTIIMADTLYILKELKSQLELNGIFVFHKFVSTSNNIQTTCPFHKDGQERKPSFGIRLTDSGKTKAGTCHCFACGWTGSFQEMISNCFGYDDFGIYGEKWLVKNFLTVAVENRPDIDLGFERKSTNDAKSEYISEEEYDKYRVYHPYMWQRKMTPEVVELFDIGYDDTDRCLTFPIRDINGNILYLAKRSVNTKFFHYPDGVEKPLYGLYEYTRVSSELSKGVMMLKVTPELLADLSDVYICESMIDAITLWTVGKYAVALNGLGNDLQFRQLNQLPCRKFILATDSDERGMKARGRISDNLKSKILTQVILPKGRKDINECTIEELQNLKEIF